MAVKSRVIRLEQARGHQQVPCWTETLTDEGHEALRIIHELIDQLGQCGVEAFERKVEEANRRIKLLSAIEAAAKRKAGVIVPRKAIEMAERDTIELCARLKRECGS